jgi:hypothetical protein
VIAVGLSAMSLHRDWVRDKSGNRSLAIKWVAKLSPDDSNV